MLTNKKIIYEATFPYEVAYEGIMPKFPFRRTYIVHTDEEPYLYTDGIYRLSINFHSLFEVVKKFPDAYRWKLTTKEGNKILEECLIYIKNGYIPLTGSMSKANILREIPDIRQVAFAENGTPERLHTLEWEIDAEIYDRRKD